MHALRPVYPAVLLASLALGCGTLENSAANAAPHTATDTAPSTVIPVSTSGDSNTETQPTNPNNPNNPNTAAPACPKPTDANDYFGQARCCNTNAVFCEDFEDATAGGNPNATFWTVQKANGDVLEISTAQAARGTKALHIHSPGATHSMITTKQGFPFVNNDFWGRAFIYWNTAAHPSNHTTYIAAGPADTAAYQWLRYSSFGSGDLGGNDSDPDNSAGSKSAMPTGKWSCLEWHYQPATHTATYLLNGAVIATLTIDKKHDNDGYMNFAQLEIGWELYSADKAVPSTGWDMFVDEVALDKKQIGCQN